MANKKKLLSKEERNYLKVPTDLKNDIRDISEELLAEMVNFNAFLLVTGKEEQSSPAYWYNKIRQLVGQSKGGLERIKTPEKDKKLVSKYYKKLNLALNYKKIEGFEEKIDSLQEDEKELTEKLEEYSNELANFEGGIKGLVELSKAFEEMKKPYIDLFIEVSDLKSELKEKPPAKARTEEELRQLVNRAVESYKKGNKDAKVLGIPVQREFDYVIERTGKVMKPLIYQSRKDYEEDVSNKIEDAKFKYFTRKNPDKRLDDITEKDLAKIKIAELIKEGLITENDIKDYPESDEGETGRRKTTKVTQQAEREYLVGKKGIKFYNAVKGRLLGALKEPVKQTKLSPKEKNKLEEEYSEKKEELSKMEEEITAMIVASSYFDKKAKGTRITGELILNRDDESMWHKSVVSDTRKKEYFSAKETFMGIQLEGQIKNEAVSIFEIMGGSYSMNLDAVTDYKKLNRQLKKLTKRIESAITIREKIDEEFAEKTKKVLEEEE